jgi:hypothetical protein
MKKLLSNIKNDRITSKGYLFTFFLLIITALYALIYYRNLPPFIPLFNQAPWGEQRLIEGIGIFLPILIGTTIAIVNLILSSVFYRKNPLVPRILTLTSFLIAILTLLFIIRTIQIVL